MPTSKPLVSCIIPTMNRPEMVERAVSSALCQTHGRMEVIVVDDSTNDETVARIGRGAYTIKFIRNGERKGAPYSRNIGLTEATGEVISFLDDDDFWDSRKIERQLPYCERYPLVGCRYRTNAWGGDYAVQGPVRITYRAMLTNNYLGSCSFVIGRRESFDGHFFEEERKAGQDWEMWLRILKANGKSDAIAPAEYLVHYDRGDHDRISSIDNRKREEHQRLFEKYREDFDLATEKMFRARFLTDSTGSLSHKMRRRIAMEGGVFPATFRYLRRKIMKPFGRLYL